MQIMNHCNLYNVQSITHLLNWSRVQVVSHGILDSITTSITATRNHFTDIFSIAIQILWKIHFAHINSNKMIAINFYTWYDNWAVMVCAKVCCNLKTINWITARWIIHQIWIVRKKIVSEMGACFRLFHAPTCTTSSGCFMLHRTVHALWNLYGNPYKNRAEKKEETVTWWGNS